MKIRPPIDRGPDSPNDVAYQAAAANAATASSSSNAETAIIDGGRRRTGAGSWGGKEGELGELTPRIYSTSHTAPTTS